MKNKLIKIIFTILISINFIYGRNIEKKISGINFKDGEIGKFIIVGKLKTARMDHTATLLDDGTVLIAGGQTIKANKEHKFDFRTKTAEIYDPKTGEFTEIPGLKYAREKHVAIKLDNGKVLFFGGIMDVSFGYKRPKEEYVEEYDPETREFRVVGELLEMSKVPFKAIKLDNGKIFVDGNCTKEATKAEIYDPKTNISRYTKNRFNYNRSDNGLLKLKDGKIILIGGNVRLPKEKLSEKDLKDLSMQSWKDEKCDLSVEIYDPETEEIELRYPLLEKRNRTNAILLNEDKILICGGYNARESIEVYDMKNNKTEIIAKLDSGIIDTELILLKNRYVLITGLDEKRTNIIKAYNINDNKIVEVGKMKGSRGGHTLTELKDGNILVVGGYDYKNIFKTYKNSIIFVVNKNK